MISKTERLSPLTRPEFDARLQQWLPTTQPNECVGDLGTRGQQPWLWVIDQGRLCHLNADSKAEGVRRYLALLDADPTLPWVVVANRRGIQNKIAFGAQATRVPGFYLYVLLDR